MRLKILEKKVDSNEKEEVECFPFIKGENIDLCPRNSKLVKTYIRWKNNPRVRKFSRNVFPSTVEEQKKRIEETSEGLKDHISFDVWYKKDQKPIGQIALSRIDWINGWANTSLQIGEPDYWNKDIGTEATKLLIEYAFNELNLNKLHGGFAIDNISSWSVAEKVGFKQEGVRRDAIYVDGRYVDNKIYLLMKEDWLTRKKD